LRLLPSACEDEEEPPPHALRAKSPAVTVSIVRSINRIWLTTFSRAKVRMQSPHPESIVKG